MTEFSPKGKFGKRLVELVAQKLIWGRGRDITYHHRDYCGQGITYRNNKFILANVHDGIFEDNDIIYEWESLESFVNYFKDLTDHRCSGKSKKEKIFNNIEPGNQNITKKRLIEFLGDYALCHKCHGLLRSAKARQCPHCGEKWF